MEYLEFKKSKIKKYVLGNNDNYGVFDFNAWLESRLNHNVFISGISGSGKSVLMSHLIENSRNLNFIFNFKPHDVYLNLNLADQVVFDLSKVYINPFLDFNAFLNAYLLAFKIQESGIMSSSIPSLLSRYFYNYDFESTFKAYNESFVSDLKENVLKNTASVIVENLKLLFPNGFDSFYSFSFLSGNIIFDFSNLNEIQKTFFLELSLHLVWSYIYSSDSQASLFLDEVSRLLFLDISIFNDVVRQIRAFGSLFVSSQNLSDVPPALLNQFDSILSFRTFLKSDYDVIENYFLNANFPLSMKEMFYYLPLHSFFILQDWFDSDLRAFYYRVVL